MPITQKRNSTTNRNDIATNWMNVVKHAIRPAVLHNLKHSKHNAGGGDVLHDDWFKSMNMLHISNKKTKSTHNQNMHPRKTKNL